MKVKKVIELLKLFNPETIVKISYLDSADGPVLADLISIESISGIAEFRTFKECLECGEPLENIDYDYCEDCAYELDSLAEGKKWLKDE